VSSFDLSERKDDQCVFSKYKIDDRDGAKDVGLWFNIYREVEGVSFGHVFVTC